MGIGINIGIEIGTHFTITNSEPATFWAWEDGTEILWEDDSYLELEGVA